MSDENTMTLRDFASQLEDFLTNALPGSTRGTVFLAENGNGVSLNIPVGAAFADNHDREEVNQINLMILPTDRTLLGSTGVSIHDGEYEDDDEMYMDDDEE